MAPNGKPEERPIEVNGAQTDGQQVQEAPDANDRTNQTAAAQ